MKCLWGFKITDGNFFKIGDEVDVIFLNGKHYEGKISGFREAENEIIVDGIIIDLDSVRNIIYGK